MSGRLVGKSLRHIDGRVVVGRKTAAVAGNRTPCHRTTGDLKARRTDGHPRSLQISNCVRDAASTVAGAQEQAVAGRRHRDHGRSRDPERVPYVVLLAFVRSEVKSFVLDDGAAETYAKLLQRSTGFGCRSLIEVISRIHGTVTAKSKRNAVDGIGAGLEPNIYDRARLPSILCWRILQKVEF